jgi:hypothetical protein
MNGVDVKKYLKHTEHQEYFDEFVRLQSYQKWSILNLQKPKDLCKAGFFYTGEEDKVNFA